MNITTQEHNRVSCIKATLPALANMQGTIYRCRQTKKNASVLLQKSTLSKSCLTFLQNGHLKAMATFGTCEHQMSL